MSKQAFDIQMKLLMVGDSGVGKSCLLVRYACDEFSESLITTIGIDFKIKTLQMNGKRIKLQIWDTAGQERQRTITTSYLRGAQGIIIVYDVAERQTFNSVNYWFKLIQMHASSDVNVILVGNKCESERREVSTEEGEELAKELNIAFFEASARKGIMVEEMFDDIVTGVKARLLNEQGDQPAEQDKEDSKLKQFQLNAQSLNISGATSFWSSNKIIGRYVPEVRDSGKPGIESVLGMVPAAFYRNIDTYSTIMIRAGRRYEIQQKGSTLAYVDIGTNDMAILPEQAADKVWFEKCGLIFSYFAPMPSLKCTVLDETNEASQAATFLSINEHASLDVDLFLQASKQPISLGLSVPLFIRFSRFQLNLLDLQFHHQKQQLDVDKMESIREQRAKILHVCDQLERSQPAEAGHPRSSSMSAAPATSSTRLELIDELRILLVDVEKHFDALCDVNKGNFATARKCRETLTVLKKRMDLLRSCSDEELGSTLAGVFSHAEDEVKAAAAAPAPAPAPALAPAAVADNDAPATATAVRSGVVVDAIAMPEAAADGTEGSHEAEAKDMLVNGSDKDNAMAQRMVQHKNSIIRITRVGWQEEYSGENRTDNDLEWKCTVTSGLVSESSVKIGGLLSGGMSVACAQLKLDMQWSTLVSKETQYEHAMKISPGSKLMVSQEVLEGTVEVNKYLGKKKLYHFRLKKEKLKYETVVL